MFKKIIFSLSFSLVSVLAVNAQQLGLYFLDGVIQSNQLNPAFVPDQKVAYSFPAFNVGMSNTIGAYNNFVTTNSEGVNVLNGDVVLNQLSANNIIRAGVDVHTFQSIFGKKKWRVSMSHAIKFNSFVNLPQDLARLAIEGNAAAIGETFQIAPDLNLSMHSETAFGAMIRFGNIDVGGKIKLLSGIANVMTDRTNATVTTDEEYYQLNFATDYRINAAGLVDIKNQDDLGDFELDWRLDEFSMSDMFNNLSIAVDLGASMSLLEDKLTVSASIVDFGKIKWKNPYNFHSQGNYTYEGVDVRDLVDNDELSFEGTLDTLKQVFDFVETNNAYKTSLPLKTYLGGQYEINKFFSAGAVVYYENYRGKNYGGYAVNASTHLGKILNFGATWTSVYQTNSLGLHAALKLGPVQLLMLTDNIVAAFDPYGNQNFNAQFGLNLIFK